MHKKSQLFLIPKTPPTKRQLIAASEFGKNPELIEQLARQLAFVKQEDRSSTQHQPRMVLGAGQAAKKKEGVHHDRR